MITINFIFYTINVAAHIIVNLKGSIEKKQQQQKTKQRTDGNKNITIQNFFLTSRLYNTIQEKKTIMATIDEIVIILKKEPTIRSENENQLLEEWSFLIPEAEARIKGELTKSILKQRAIEQEESIDSIEKKADTLANLIKESNYCVIYSGAGISTSASIPDYRGPNGLWTQIRKTGKFSITKIYDLSNAEPTTTHMAIKELCRRKIVKHVVSQNCDGLHLRSGIPQNQLSEIHGNMFIEVCPTCERQYFRQADITEKTCRFRHKTGRKCHTCKEPNNNLIDTIVLYGERSRTKWPMNWERAGKAAKKADLIICMGSSLKTLRRYNSLWPKKSNNNNNSTQSETKLVIINLQYTSKDKNAVLKINGKCDLVMQLVMQRLNINIPSYNWLNDPLMKLAVPFTQEERQELKRNLIFETKQRQQKDNLRSPAAEDDINNSSMKDNSNNMSAAGSELSKSPSLFVSELTDDPEKKSLRMRIRAVNNTPTSDNNHTYNGFSPSSLIKHEQDNNDDKMSIDGVRGIDIQLLNRGQGDSIITTSKEQTNTSGFALPGWLGKSLGSTKTSYYKRKRHGNKGRKHSSVLKQQQQLQLPNQGEQIVVEELTSSSQLEVMTTNHHNQKITTTTTTTNTTSPNPSVKIEHKPLDLVHNHHNHHRQSSVVIESSIV